MLSARTNVILVSYVAEESSPNTKVLILNIKICSSWLACSNNVCTLVSPKQGLSCASNHTNQSDVHHQTPRCFLRTFTAAPC